VHYWSQACSLVTVPSTIKANISRLSSNTSTRSGVEVTTLNSF
jgi:hypothetical protein